VPIPNPVTYPSGAYVSPAGASASPPTSAGLHVSTCNGVALQCPVQYDGPAGATGSQDYICYVYATGASLGGALPSGVKLAVPVYNPLEQVCTQTNMLCPVKTPLAYGMACFDRQA
jgi:hypothetical protein